MLLVLTSAYQRLSFCLRVHQGLTSLMTSVRAQTRPTFCKYTVQRTLVLFGVLWDVVGLQLV